MTTRLIVLGKASTITRQLAALQAQGLCPSGPKIIERNTGGQHEHDLDTSTTQTFKGARAVPQNPPGVDWTTP
jgi:hypothetical protein